ncbi:hypothetical protein T4D_244 [Trichinella pseudospiralis]|uniref:Uncharacterized protein n=1 Tax=Trichinella pseudospiralis TaxID=6337 RepID=A0A0V1FTR4_TRIPS|nr:hypothetical protein T4D_244 [Trichinella pseudospiralis]
MTKLSLVVTQAFGLCQPVREIKLPCRHDRHPFIHSFIHSSFHPSIHPFVQPSKVMLRAFQLNGKESLSGNN